MEYSDIKKSCGEFAVVFNPDGTLMTKGKLQDVTCLAANGVDVGPWMVGSYDFTEDEIAFIQNIVQIHLVTREGKEMGTKNAATVKFGNIVAFTKFEFGGKEYVKTPPCGGNINAVSLIRGKPSWFGVDTFVDVRKTRADVLDGLIGMEVTLILEVEGLGNWPARNVLEECDGKYSVRFDANATIEFTQGAVTRILEVDGMPTIRIGGSSENNT